jgi:hypothetical protein
VLLCAQKQRVAIELRSTGRAVQSHRVVPFLQQLQLPPATAAVIQAVVVPMLLQLALQVSG